MSGGAELGPGTSLDGALVEAGPGDLADAGDGGDLHLLAVLVELVLDDPLRAALVGADDLRGREQVAEVVGVVLLQLSPSDLRRCRRCHGHRRRAGRRRLRG